MTPRTPTPVLIEAMLILARDIQSGDGVANAAILEAAQRLGETKQDAARYRWLRDRMQIRHEAPMFGGRPREVLSMRIGHAFLDGRMDPRAGWADQRYFDECRDRLDSAIDDLLAQFEREMAK